MNTTENNQKIEFKSKGFVHGNAWGGGEGAYAASPLKADTKEVLLAEAKRRVEDGSLDNGMGFESLNGALLFITKVTTIEVDGKEFTNEEYEHEFVGDLTEEQQDFLDEVSTFQ